MLSKMTQVLSYTQVQFLVILFLTNIIFKIKIDLSSVIFIVQ